MSWRKWEAICSWAATPGPRWFHVRTSQGIATPIALGQKTLAQSIDYTSAIHTWLLDSRFATTRWSATRSWIDGHFEVWTDEPHHFVGLASTLYDAARLGLSPLTATSAWSKPGALEHWPGTGSH